MRPTSVLAIDPGPKESAWVLWEPGAREHTDIFSHGKSVNDDLLHDLRVGGLTRSADVVVVEMVASYGMAVGAEVFETCVAIGRFIEASRTIIATWRIIEPPLPPPRQTALVYRRDVKLHLCHSAQAKDANVRQAIIDRFGGKDSAIGRKATPGPLYGIKADEWSALAVALYYADTQMAADE
jgi:hypothetical protein